MNSWIPMIFLVLALLVTVALPTLAFIVCDLKKKTDDLKKEVKELEELEKRSKKSK